MRTDEFQPSNVAMTIGATVNMSPINNREVICYSSPQDHCVTRGFMTECSPTINAAAGMSGNNKPFVVKPMKERGYTVLRRDFSPLVLNFMGSKGNNVISKDGACPTINAMHGSDVHVVCIPINSMVIGKDGGNGDRQTFGIGDDGDPCPTIQTAHHHAVAIRMTRKAYGIDQQGGKGGANFTEDVAPTICSDSHGTPHGVCLVKGGEKE